MLQNAYIHSQKWASIQPRTSPPKFGKKNCFLLGRAISVFSERPFKRLRPKKNYKLELILLICYLVRKGPKLRRRAIAPLKKQMCPAVGPARKRSFTRPSQTDATPRWLVASPPR